LSTLSTLFVIRKGQDSVSIQWNLG